jgi:hypothetical protein
MKNMSFALTRINIARNVKTRVFTDPEQYDTEINAARGFSKSSTTRRRPPMTEDFSDLNEASQLINHVTNVKSSRHRTSGRNPLWIFLTLSSLAVIT